MKEIYIVTGGRYSDYGIECVCLSKEIAEKIASALSSPYHECSVETWELLEEMPKIYSWVCRMKPSGEVVSVEAWTSSLGATNGTDDNGNFYSVGETREAAIKNTSDFRAEQVARKIGI